MKFRKVIGILSIVLILSLMTVAPVLADQPDCQSLPYDFIHSHTIEFSPGDWPGGFHAYQIRVTLPDSTTLEFDPILFNVTEDAPLYSGQVYLRYWGLASQDGVIIDREIHPDQDTVMQLTWAYENDWTAKDRKAFLDTLMVEFKWDAGEYVAVPHGPIVSYCSVLNKGNFIRNWGGPWR